MALAVPRNRFFGRSEAPIEVAGFTLSISRHEGGLATPVHYHECAYICFALDGLFVEDAARGETLCEPGLGILHPIGHEHRDRFHRDSSCLNVTYSNRTAPSTSLMQRSKRSQSYARSMASETAKSPIETPALAARVLAFAFCFERPSREPAWLSAIQCFLADYCGPYATVSWLSDAFEIHPVHLAREFRRHYGTPIERYIDLCRVDRAASLLQDTDMEVGRVSDVAGFSSTSRMCKVFRRELGRTPGELRTH